MKIRTEIAAAGAAGVLFWTSAGWTGWELGRYSGEFMAAGGGGASLGLGGTGAARAGDAWSLLWNPAGLASVQIMQIGLMHSERFDGVVDYDAAAWAMPQIDGSVWAAGLVRLGVNGIPFTRLAESSRPISADNRVLVDKVVSSGDWAFYAGWAQARGRARWGVAPKLVFRHIGGEYRAYGLGLDAGGAVALSERVPIEAGLMVRDALGTVTAWEQTGLKEVTAPSLTLGLAGRFVLPALEATVSPVFDASYRTENLGGSGAGSLHMGVEYLIKNLVALRVGSDDGRVTYGGGVVLPAVAVDYAYVGHEELGGTHRVSVVLKWRHSSRRGE